MYKHKRKAESVTQLQSLYAQMFLYSRI